MASSPHARFKYAPSPASSSPLQEAHDSSSSTLAASSPFATSPGTGGVTAARGNYGLGSRILADRFEDRPLGGGVEAGYGIGNRILGRRGEGGDGQRMRVKHEQHPSEDAPTSTPFRAHGYYLPNLEQQPQRQSPPRPRLHAKPPATTPRMSTDNKRWAGEHRRKRGIVRGSDGGNRTHAPPSPEYEPSSPAYAVTFDGANMPWQASAYGVPSSDSGLDSPSTATLGELIKLCQRYNLPLSPERVAELFAECEARSGGGAGARGRVSWAQFIDLLHERQRERLDQELKEQGREQPSASSSLAAWAAAPIWSTSHEGKSSDTFHYPKRVPDNAASPAPPESGEHSAATPRRMIMGASAELGMLHGLYSDRLVNDKVLNSVILNKAARESDLVPHIDAQQLASDEEEWRREWSEWRAERAVPRGYRLDHSGVLPRPPPLALPTDKEEDAAAAEAAAAAADEQQYYQGRSRARAAAAAAAVTSDEQQYYLRNDDGYYTGGFGDSMTTNTQGLAMTGSSELPGTPHAPQYEEQQGHPSDETMGGLLSYSPIKARRRHDGFQVPTRRTMDGKAVVGAPHDTKIHGSTFSIGWRKDPGYDEPRRPGQGRPEQGQGPFVHPFNARVPEGQAHSASASHSGYGGFHYGGFRDEGERGGGDGGDGGGGMGSSTALMMEREANNGSPNLLKWDPNAPLASGDGYGIGNRVLEDRFADRAIGGGVEEGYGVGNRIIEDRFEDRPLGGGVEAGYGIGNRLLGQQPAPPMSPSKPAGNPSSRSPSPLKSRSSEYGRKFGLASDTVAMSGASKYINVSRRGDQYLHSGKAF